MSATRQIHLEKQTTSNCCHHSDHPELLDVFYRAVCLCTPEDTVVHSGAPSSTAGQRKQGGVSMPINFLQLNVPRFVFPLLPSFTLVIRRREKQEATQAF